MPIPAALYSTQPAEGPLLEAHLLGQLDYDDCLSLQHRLVYELSGRADGRIQLLLCEHPRLISVGREGSWNDLPDDAAARAALGLDVRWVSRGGGAVVHQPGQLAVYPIVPLFYYGWTVGEYLAKVRDGLASMLAELGVHAHSRPGSFDLWGRTGMLVAAGASVRSWTTFQGFFINSSATMDVARRARPAGGGEFSSITRERRRPVPPTRLREATIRALTVAFGVSRYHVSTGHPLLRAPTRSNHEAARAG